MAKMTCKCGEYLSNQQSPNDIQLCVYTDREWDSILEQDIWESWKIPMPTYDVWRCPKCERIYVFGKADKEGNVKAIKIYCLEYD